jgi:hypothetical protein
MYLVTFSTIATSLIYLLNGSLILDYGLWISFWSSVGTVAGMWGVSIYMKKVGR